MTKVILHLSTDIQGTDTVDLEFKPRSHSAATKWLECLRSVGDRSPHNYAYLIKEKDLPMITDRIDTAIRSSSELLEFLGDRDLTMSYDLVNTVHRFIELHKDQAHIHLTLHNDIHMWEGLTKDLAYPAEERAKWNVPWKIQWNPPGQYIPFDPEDYLLYGTERTNNFLMQDFAHVGRDPFNSFKFRDDRSMETSCVIQHAVTSGFFWIKQDDSGNYTNQEAEFRNWVKENMWFFSSAGVVDEYDPRLCFGRMILADGIEDYSNLDSRYEYVLGVRVVN